MMDAIHGPSDANVATKQSAGAGATEWQGCHMRQLSVDLALRMPTHDPRTADELIADAKKISEFILGSHAA